MTATDVTTADAIEALRADRGALLELCATLGDADWKAESGCPGWSVQDVVSHMGALYWLVVDPSQLPSTDGLPTEQAQDHVVDVRRSWPADRVVEDYAAVSTQAIEALVGLIAQDFVLPLGDLGTYHASQLALPYAFDHYTHIRADLFAPRGPLTTSPPPDDALRLDPALDWMAAAIAQQNPEQVAGLTGTIDIHVVGTAARTITVGTGPVSADLTAEAPALVRAITQRGSWDDLGVTGAGDEADLALVRTMKVF